MGGIEKKVIDLKNLVFYHIWHDFRDYDHLGFTLRGSFFNFFNDRKIFVTDIGVKTLRYDSGIYLTKDARTVPKKYIIDENLDDWKIKYALQNLSSDEELFFINKNANKLQKYNNIDSYFMNSLFKEVNFSEIIKYSLKNK